MIQKQFEIQTGHFDESKQALVSTSAVVDGWTCGAFGFFEETLDGAPETVRVFPVTHLPTGRVMCFANCQQSAQEIINFLLKTDIDWDNFNSLDYCEKVKISNRLRGGMMFVFQSNGWLHQSNKQILHERDETTRILNRQLQQEQAAQ
jgi:hypothetical protein